LIGEAVESFLRQDYRGEKELIIVNDHPEIPLSLPDHPEITLVNRQERFASVGVKRNWATWLSKGTVIFPWDDDDISLPWRISYSLEAMTNCRYFKPSNLWWWQHASKSLRLCQGVMAHAMCAYHRDVFEQIGGYPDFNSGEDQEFENRMNRRDRLVKELSHEDIFYIYRMEGTDTYHLSYYGYGKGWEESAQFVTNNVAISDYLIEPAWKESYDEIALGIAHGR